jgi:GR25 family glycosyltransferase involved in LPS biosynthesis
MTVSMPALPMFIINLDSRPERLATFRKAFDPLGYTIERFRAIRPAPSPISVAAAAPTSSAPSSAPASARRIPPYGGSGRRR